MSRGIVAKQRQASSRVVCALTIAGSDPSGGAGIQADLRTFQSLGVHGLSAITAVTAQNTQRVLGIHRVPAGDLKRQLDALAADFVIAAVKIGMLGSRAAIIATAEFLRARPSVPVVLDPVLVSSSGTRLLPAAALSALRRELIPLADLLTPNLPEARALMPRAAIDDGKELARGLRALGARAVLVKGGHNAADPICDYLVERAGVHVFRHRRLPLDARGTGCTLSAAIAANLARGMPLKEAVRAAESYLQRRLRTAYRAGHGQPLMLGPLAAG